MTVLYGCWLNEAVNTRGRSVGDRTHLSADKQQLTHLMCWNMKTAAATNHSSPSFTTRLMCVDDAPATLVPGHTWCRSGLFLQWLWFNYWLVGLWVVWFVSCSADWFDDYTKRTEHISTQLGWRMGSWPRTDPTNCFSRCCWILVEKNRVYFGGLYLQVSKISSKYFCFSECF